MIKRLLLLLDETPSSVAARHFALRLAQDTAATLTGLAGVDLKYIEKGMPGSIGAASYQADFEQTAKTQAESKRRNLHKIFQSECSARGIQHDSVSFDGDPMETLFRAAELRDLVISGHDTAFYHSMKQSLSSTLQKLLSNTPRPVIVCPDHEVDVREIMIAYDGSLSSVRAIQLFALLGLKQRRRAHVVSIDADEELATRKADNAANYLRSHLYEVEPCPIATKDYPIDVLTHEINRRSVGMLVMGAYGHRGIKDFLFGSTTAKLVGEPPCALFVYH